MDDSSATSRAHVYTEVRPLVTPTRRRNRPSNRHLAREATNPYRRRSSQMTPPGELSPPAMRRRCVSAGSASARSYLPSPEPDKTTTPVSKTKSPESTRVVISLLSEDELSESESPRTRPYVPTSSRSAPEVPSIQRAKINDTTPTRPKLSRQTKSEPPRQASTTPATTDKRIQACIREPLTKTQFEYEGVGNNYVFEVVTGDRSGNKVVKIGVTKGPEQLRLNVIAKQCRHLMIEERNDLEHMPIRLYERAEKLAHKELADYKHSFKCKCKVKDHREYFNIDKSVALEVVQRWRWFCRQEPYDASGKLKPFWEHRLREFSNRRNLGTKSDHKERAKRWTDFMSPSQFEMIWFGLKGIVSKLWRRRWITIALIECFIIIILVNCHRYSVYVFVLMAVGVAVEESDIHNLLSLNAFKWAAQNSRRQALSQASTADFSNTTSKIAIVDEDEIPGGHGLGEEVDGDLEDLESDCSSEIESPPIEVEDDTDTIGTEDDVGAASEETTLPVTK